MARNSPPRTADGGKPPGSKIEVEGLSVTFQSPERSLSVLEDINLSIAAGEILTLIGPSGSGKSTILNMISGTLDGAGLQRQGRLNINWDSQLPNRLGYVFQKDTLLPWRTLLTNDGAWRNEFGYGDSKPEGFRRG